MSRTSGHYIVQGYAPAPYVQYQYNRAGQPVISAHHNMTRKHVEPHAGQQPMTLKKQQERAIREAYRKEKKIESYLADDENFPSFAIQLKKLGLYLRDIPADGNCLFRALGDQLEGHCRNHYRHRQEVVKYMLDHRKDFEPFVEDDMPFDVHVNNLKKLGTHAGNDAIVAFAKLHNVNVMIHQLNGKPLMIQGPSASAAVRQLHIAYHNGDHYSSVRREGDNTESPANIKLQEDATGPAPSFASEAYDGTSGIVTAQRGLEHLEAEVMRATGCEDVEQVRETLEDCDYDVDATIATLLQTMVLTEATLGEDTTSLTSQQTADSGIWAANGSGTRVFGGGVSGQGSLNSKGHTVHYREDSYGGSSGYSSLGSNRGGGARPKLAIPASHVKHHVVTSRQMKDMKKMEKKRRQTERNQQKILASDPRYMQQPSSSYPDDAVVIKHDITRI